MAPQDLKALIRAYHKARGERNWETCGGDAPEEWRWWTVEVAMLAGKWALARRASHPENQYSADAFTLQALVSFLSCALVKATGEVQRALELSPSHKDALQLLQRIKRVQELRSLGNEAYNTGRLLEAIQKFTEGLGPIGESESEGMGGIIRANLLLNRALSLYRLKRYEEAVKDCNACLLLEPDAFKALRTRARSRRALRLYEASMEDYEAAYQYTSTQAERDLLREEANAVLNLLAESIRKDYYKILGVSEGCPEADIRKAYRAQALAHHPDKGGDEELFKLIGEAYAVLSEPPARSRYDAEKPIPRKFSPKEPAIPREGDAHAGGQAPKESGKKEKATASSTAPKPGSAAKTPASPHKDDSKDVSQKRSVSHKAL
ncbi:DnaJ-domain-containing protein [Sistotremastrum niveocremeum HHB9708]|uniref:DnaJ-domain-containing protein n=1 Tax=Sistotremastrum niveocremeum HHB9708 TaxID=1314777 RepID=A0A164WA44_9AGAM|nr:DnaJ-domain-containing protein [Sistotremastrum niveocremeum HHB9708]